MTIFLPAADAGRLEIGDEARIILDPVPDYVIPAKVSFVAADAQFTPKTVETKDERAKLMFRVKLKIDPQVLQHLHAGEDGRAGLSAPRRSGRHRQLKRRARSRRDVARPSSQVKLPTRRPTQNDRRAVARVKNVSHRYGATVALDDVSIDIPARIMVGADRARRRRQVHAAGADRGRAQDPERRGRRLRRRHRRRRRIAATSAAASPICRRASAAISIRR